MNEDDPRAARFKEAVFGGRIEELRALFAEEPELGSVIDAPWFHFAKPAIVQAAAALDRPLVDALLDLGADIDARSAWEAGPYNALHSLVDGATPERLAFADYLVERGARIDLHAAAGMGRVDVIERILDAEPERVSEPGPDGATPLHLAKDASVAQLLLDRGAELDKRCVDHTSTPAMWACQGREDVVRLLLDRGARPDLYMAALLDDVALARRILETEPSAIGVRVTHGRSHEHLGFGDKYVWALEGADTPLEVARRRGNDRVYAFLLERSAPPARLVQASRRGDASAIEDLLDRHPDLPGSLEDWEACQALTGSVSGARALLAAGADPNVRDDGAGATPLHIAAWEGMVELAGVLLEGGADPAIRDRTYDGTPLGWALHGGRPEIAELLERYGSERAP